MNQLFNLVMKEVPGSANPPIFLFFFIKNFFFLLNEAPIVILFGCRSFPFEMTYNLDVCIACLQK